MATQRKCLTFVDGKLAMLYTDEYVEKLGATDEPGAAATMITLKYPKFGYPEILISFQWGTKHSMVDIATAQIICKPSAVTHRPIGVLSTAKDFAAFSKIRGLPAPAEDEQAVFLNLFVRPGGIMFTFDQKHRANFNRLTHRYGSQLAESAKLFKGLFANLDEEINLEFVMSNANKMTMEMVNEFNARWITEDQNPLLPLAARTMSTLHFHRGNILSPAETNFELLDPPQYRFDDMVERAVKLSYGTFYEQLYDESQRALLATKPIMARALAVEGSKVDGVYTRFFILTDIADESDMDLMPKADKESVTLELFVPYTAPKIPNMPLGILEDNPRVRATRVEVPRSLRSMASTMLIADVPHVRNWPEEAGAAPYLNLEIPLLEKGADLESTAKNAMDREQSLKGQKNPHLFKMLVHRDSTDTTMNMELSVLSKFAVAEEDHSPWAQLSRWMLNFKGQVIPHRVLQMFPILKAVSNKAKVFNAQTPDRKSAVDEDPSGVNPVESAPSVHSAPTSDATLLDEGLVERFWLEYLSLDKDQQACFLDMESLPFGIQAVFGVPGAGKTRLMLLVVAMSPLADATKIIWPQALISGPVNTQVDDVCYKLQELIERLELPINVIRLNTIERELSNVLNKDREQKDIAYNHLPDFDMHVTTENELSKLLGTFHADRIERRKIKGGVLSASESAWYMVENKPDHPKVAPILDLMNLRSRSPLEFKFAASRYRQLWKDLIVYIIQGAHIVVGTPVTAMKIATMVPDESIFNPQIVWSDEVGRATEASGLAAMAFFQNALVRLLSGDPNQCEQIAFSRSGTTHAKESDKYFINPFVKQYTTSIIKRMKECDAPVSYLRISHRMRGQLEVFPSRQFYGNRMTSPPVGHHDEVQRWRLFLTLYCREIIASSLYISLEKGSEVKDLQSYTNPMNARFVVHLALDIFKNEVCGQNPTKSAPGKRAKILIIAAYASQKMLYQALFAKLSPAEFVPDLVEIRTIFGAQGHEADVVIFDTVRTTKLGFLTENANVNVALTRARYGLIVVGQNDCWKDSGSSVFNNLCRYHIKLGALRYVKDHREGLDCRRCHGKHPAAGCKSRVICPNCPEGSNHHHVRNCWGSNIQNMKADFPAGYTLPKILKHHQKAREGLTLREMRGLENPKGDDKEAQPSNPSNSTPVDISEEKASQVFEANPGKVVETRSATQQEPEGNDGGYGGGDGVDGDGCP
ncbi:AAA domain-containing protein [Apiospora kogelbergensis]|uniref:AAA domain-containing protein n=1 Tax=Apiospora kogelbergensis TaxID=1337665 RepID=UPI00312F6C0E